MATESPCTAGPAEFVESGGSGLIERADSDSDVVTGIRWSTYPDCERVVIEFAAASGAPAVAPPGVGPLFIRSSGLMRLQLDAGVSRSAVLDQVVEGMLVDRAYVARRSTGELFVDLHMGQPALIRVTVASGPARIVVDAIPGGDPYPTRPAVTDQLVLVDPAGDSAVYPFTVNGYTRATGETIQVDIEVAGVTETYDGEVGTGGDAWGAFTVLVPDGPDGPATIIVGESFPLSITLS
ncbi:MAG: hypothetical protein R3246_05365 [Acidimicrobiia bacterium]|nr:hypothetical protein [Acidimicrobiia bacterium]